MNDLLKKNMHILIAICTVFTALPLLFTGGNTSQFIVVNGDLGESEDVTLKTLVCREAIKEIRSGSLSDHFFHPAIISQIKDSDSDDYKLPEDSKIFVHLIGMNICKGVVKTNIGFKSYEAVISQEGPLIFRVTSMIPKKPTIEEVKEYL